MGLVATDDTVVAEWVRRLREFMKDQTQWYYFKELGTTTD